MAGVPRRPKRPVRETASEVSSAVSTVRYLVMVVVKTNVIKVVVRFDNELGVEDSVVVHGQGAGGRRYK